MSKDKKVSKSKEPSKRRGLLRPLCIALAALLILCTLVYSFGGFEKIEYALFYSQRIIDSAVSGSGFPISFTGNDIISAGSMSGKLYSMTQKLLTCISSSGQLLFTETFTFVEPVMKLGDKYGLIYDNGSSKYLIFNSRGIVYRGSTEDNLYIISGEIDGKGNVVFATKSNDSACRVSMYSLQGKVKYIWSCAEEYVVSLDISNDGKNILCAALGAYNNDIYTKVYNLDTDSADTPGAVTLYSSSCVNISYSSGNKAIADCLDKRVILDLRADNGAPIEAAFSGDIVCMDRDSRGNLAVITERLNSFDSNEITLYDKNNTVIYKNEVSDGVTKILCENGKVYCLTDNTVLTIDKSGKIIDVFECDINGKGLVELKNRIYYYSSAYIKEAF